MITLERKCLFTFFICFVTLLNINAQLYYDVEETPFESSRSEILQKVNRVKIPWIKNKGQQNEKVVFYANTFAGVVYITSDGSLTYNLFANNCCSYTITERFIGAEVSKIQGEVSTFTKVNYFLGNDLNHWSERVPTYNVTRIHEVWDGIDLKILATGNNIEKVFEIEPGTNPKRIKVKISGVESLKINEKSELVIKTANGELKFSKPSAFQLIEGEKKNVEVEYFKRGRMYGFRTGDYNKHHPLFIDPVIASTLLGGNQTDMVNAISIDNSGYVFITGRTKSNDFPIAGDPFDPCFNEGFDDVFVTKLSKDLDSVLASTYLGGSGMDFPYSLSVDENGNIFVSGNTDSNNFPTTDFAFNRTNRDCDAFISKFNNDLSSLLASTFLGGTKDEFWPHMTLDNDGCVYITGCTESSDFPITPEAFDSTKNNGDDIFVSKMSSDLDSLIASTYIGGNGNEDSYSISISESGEVYIMGSSFSTDYPMTELSYKNVLNGSVDVVVSKLNNDLSQLIGSTYIGGNNEDYGYCIALDTSDNVFILGSTCSDDFPVSINAIDNLFEGSSEIFVAKFNTSLSELMASTFLGGNSSERPECIVSDDLGNIYLSGSSYSADFPVTSNAFYQSINGERDAILSILDNDLVNLLFSTFLGGIQHEAGNSIFLDNNGLVYLAGATNSFDFPTFGSPFVDTLNSGSFDCFVSKFEITLPVSTGNNTATNENLSIYPNPFSSSAKIKFPNPNYESFRMTLYDLSGQSVRVIEGIQNTTIELQRNNLSSGLYLIEIQGPKIYKGKVIIQ